MCNRTGAAPRSHGCPERRRTGQRRHLFPTARSRRRSLSADSDNGEDANARVDTGAERTLCAGSGHARKRTALLLSTPRYGDHARLTGDELGGDRRATHRRGRSTAKEGTASHLGAAGEGLDRGEGEEDEAETSGKKTEQRRTSTARRRFRAPSANLQEGIDGVEVQEDARGQLLQNDARRRRIRRLTGGTGHARETHGGGGARNRREKRNPRAPGRP